MPFALLVRLPRLRFRAVSRPVIPADAQARYPELGDDLTTLERHVAPAFTDRDREALTCQNSYRRVQLSLFVASALLTGLGGLQAVWPERRWPGILLAVLGVLLTALTQWEKERDWLTRFLTARVRAERLRALHFQYLARVSPFGGPDRQATLLKAVLAINAGPGATASDRTDHTGDGTGSTAATRAEQFHQLYLKLRILDQLGYYEDRRQEYERAGDQASAVRVGLLLASSSAALAGQFATGTERAGWSVGAAMLAALAGLVTAYESLIGFTQLTKVYQDAAAALAQAQIDWETTEPRGDLTAQVERVEAAISRENGQWGQLVTEPRAVAPASPAGGPTPDGARGEGTSGA